MVRVDIVVKDGRGRFQGKEDVWRNLTPEQAVVNLRRKYGVTVGFARWLERMDDLIWKLDKGLADECRLFVRESKADSLSEEEVLILGERRRYLSDLE